MGKTSTLQLLLIEAEIEAKKREISTMQKQLSEKMNAAKELRNQIELSKKGITVSDHAVVRYLERVEGLNIEAVKSLILAESVETQIKKFGGEGNFYNGDLKICVKGYNVTTVI